jgi:DNA-binding GntR family transcriptional regulator
VRTEWDAPPTRASSSYYAAQYIRRLIFDGSLRPGERVPQDEIAKALALSRIPVREAIIGLEREGLVTSVLHRGAFVNTLDEQSVLDQYELNGLLYGFAAERALERSDGAFVGRLREILGALATTGDGDHALEFHRTVVAASASPRIDVVIRSLPALATGAAADVEAKGLRRVLRALERDDGPAAAVAYADVMHRIGDRVVELFRRRKVTAT